AATHAVAAHGPHAICRRFQPRNSRTARDFWQPESAGYVLAHGPAWFGARCDASGLDPTGAAAHDALLCRTANRPPAAARLYCPLRGYFGQCMWAGPFLT